MNYLKVFFKNICGYVMDTVFSPTKDIFEETTFNEIPKAINEHPFIFSIFYYKNAKIKKMIKLIKYKGNKQVTKLASKILYDYLLEDISEKIEMSNFTRPIIIPIPATRHRLKEFGFNQCRRIVQEIEKIDENNFLDFSYKALIKIKDNESLAHTKNRIERLKNIKNSFSVKNTDAIYNRNIILIDDVWTTGATIEEASKELLKAGARKVMAYTIAH